jgi:hypothetical protein
MSFVMTSRRIGSIIFRMTLHSYHSTDDGGDEDDFADDTDGPSPTGPYHLERSDFLDSLSRSDDEGWFYSDRDVSDDSQD